MRKEVLDKYLIDLTSKNLTISYTFLEKSIGAYQWITLILQDHIISKKICVWGQTSYN
jgi:hypothetical protein